MRMVAVLLLSVCIALGAGIVALLVAFVGQELGLSGGFLALSGGLWLLYVLLITEYPSALGRGTKREESK